MEKSCNIYGRFFQGVLIGGFLGALAGFFFAPKSGKELRADVKEKGLEAQALLKEKSKEAQAFFEEAKHRAAEWKEGAQQRFAKVKGILAKERGPEYTEPMEEIEGTA
jgi:gas vesicle protein